MDVIRNLQQELAYLRNKNERLLNTSEEQERMIRELTQNSSHRSMELERLKRKKMVGES